MKTSYWIVVVVIVVLVLGYLGRHQIKSLLGGSSTPTPATTEVASPTPAMASPTASSSATQTTVKISSTGFTPQSITIKAGETVTWMNTDSAPHNVNSDPHPTHTAYTPLNLGTIQPGASKSLMFPTAGTYGYHDHLNPQFKGTVVVQ